jgi:uncharacterized protein (TIGR00661 family)
MKRVLVTPLDWGLGHATRCIPVIRELISSGCEVVIGGNGPSLSLLELEFPQLHFFRLPGYDPVYPRTGTMVWKMMRQLPKFAGAVRAEHQLVGQMIKELRIDAIVSDNRYGCWSEIIPSILITHQSNVLMPQRFGWLAPLVRQSLNRKMKKFTTWWIPDSPERKFSGLLTSSGHIDKSVDKCFIGAISRFKRVESREKRFDVSVVISGPEPQRTILEQTVVPQLQGSKLRYFVVRGLPDSKTPPTDNIADFLSSVQLQELIGASHLVIARSGYSTVMDMAALGAKAIFIPTPGQTEQEYLAGELKKNGVAYSVSQKEFDLPRALRESAQYTGFGKFAPEPELLKEAMKKLVTSISDHQPIL